MQQTITGRFWDFLRLDPKKEIADYVVVPEYRTEGTVNGKLKCRGKPGLYARGMPISVTGVLKDGIFYANISTIPTSTKDNVLNILSYADKTLSDAEKENVAECCKNDLFSFCKDEQNVSLLAHALGEENEDMPRAWKLFRKLRNMLENNLLSEKLLQYGISYEVTERLSRKGVTLDTLKKNPYKAFMKNGVPFTIADIYARKECNVAPYSMARLNGIVIAAFMHALSSGHTCLTLDQLVHIVGGITKKLQPGIPESPALIHACVADLPNFCQYHLAGNGQYLYINHVWEEESAAVQGVNRLQASAKLYKQDVSVYETEQAVGFTYNQEQRAAFQILKSGGVKILTGPPGSGKTALLKGLIHNFRANGNGKVCLAATTGMAAKVMQSATGEECETAHKLLRIIPHQNSVRGRDLNDPVEGDLVIVDEVSMMGLQVFSILVQAIRNGAILLLVGDEDQLQSVEYGNVLHDLIQSGKVETYRLVTCIRNSGVIFDNAKKINAGRKNLVYTQEFQVRELNPKRYIEQVIREYDPDSTQVICPVNDGRISVRSLNIALQEYLNGKSPVAARYGSRIFRIGDRVIMKKTDYGRGYVNGDQGRILSFSENGELLVAFPDGNLYLNKDDYCNLELAYCITIHKSEGSTFGRVVVILPDSARNMMTRRLLYTAVTRASQSVTVYSEKGAFEAAIENRSEYGRYTCLSERISGIPAKSSEF